MGSSLWLADRGTPLAEYCVDVAQDAGVHLFAGFFEPYESRSPGKFPVHGERFPRREHDTEVRYGHTSDLHARDGQVLIRSGILQNRRCHV